MILGQLVARTIPGPPYPLPDWLAPWVFAGLILLFIIVLIWAARERRKP